MFLFLDFSGLAGVEHHLVDLLKWEDENGVIRELKIYSKIAHRWRQIATQLGFELGEIDSIEENHHRNHSRVTAVLSQWFDNAVNLPNASQYPKSWLGLINLLEDAELGEVAEELRTALTESAASQPVGGTGDNTQTSPDTSPSVRPNKEVRIELARHFGFIASPASTTNTFPFPTPLPHSCPGNGCARIGLER